MFRLPLSTVIAILISASTGWCDWCDSKGGHILVVAEAPPGPAGSASAAH